MGLEVHWYDIFCFAIVAGAIIAALWMIFENEGGRHRKDRTSYESLLVATAPQTDGGDGALYTAGYVSSAELWMPCWRGVHPSWLLALRFISFVIMAWILTLDIQAYEDPKIMYYYTEWTFTLVMVYFVIATLISAHGCWIYSKQYVIENEEANGFLRRDFEGNTSTTLTYKLNRKRDTVNLQSHHEEEVYKKRAGFLGYLMQVIYQTSAGAVVLTDAVFWGLIVPFLSLEHFSLNLVMVCMHSLNAVFLLLDTALNSQPFPWFRMAYFILWSCIYVIFQWIVHACGMSWWPYPFLELSTAWAPLWYFCLALVHIPCYGLYYLIVKAKYTLLPKYFPHCFIRSY